MCEESFPRCRLEEWNPAVEARVGPFETQVRFTAISENRNSKKQGTNSWPVGTSRAGRATGKARRCATTPNSDVRFLPSPPNAPRHRLRPTPGLFLGLQVADRRSPTASHTAGKPQRDLASEGI